MDKDGYISNGELFQVLKMMVGNNLKDTQLQQIVDKTIIHADTDGDGKISFEEFCSVSIVGGFDSAFRKQIVCSLIYILVTFVSCIFMKWQLSKIYKTNWSLGFCV